MVHYYNHIKNFGSPNGLCSSITESKHITAVKRPWRRSNKHMALPQMLKVNKRLNKIAAARTDFTARGMLADSCLVQAIKDALIDMAYSSDDSMDDDTDSETSDEEIRTSNSSHTDAQDYNARMHGPSGADEHTTPDMDDSHLCTPQRLSPTPPTNEEDDDCGPVESGPLMNEVRLVGRKGKHLHCG